MEDGRLAAELDDAYSRAQAQIEALLGAPGPLNRGLRIRAKAWLSAMRMPTLNTVWKRNRNQHARLLLAQLRAGVLQAPFDALPPQNGLPTLQPWMIYRFMSPTRRGASPLKSGGDAFHAEENVLERGDVRNVRCSPPGAAFVEGIHAAEAAQHRIRHGINASPKRSSHCAATPRMETHELRAGLTEADGRANLSDWRAGAAMSQMSKQDRELSAARQESEELMRQVSQSAAEHERAQGAAKVAAKSRLDALIETFEGRQAEWQPGRVSDTTMPRQDPAVTGAPTAFQDPALGAPSSYRGPAPGVPSQGSVSDVPSSYRDSVPHSPRSHRDPAPDAPRSNRDLARSNAPSSYRDPAPDVPSSYRDPAPNAPSSFGGSAPGAPRSHRELAPDAPSSHHGPTRSDAPSSYRDPASDVPSSFHDSGPNAPSSNQGSAPNSYRGPSNVPPSEPSLRGMPTDHPRLYKESTPKANIEDHNPDSKDVKDRRQPPHQHQHEPAGQTWQPSYLPTSGLLAPASLVMPPLSAYMPDYPISSLSSPARPASPTPTYDRLKAHSWMAAPEAADPTFRASNICASAANAAKYTSPLVLPTAEEAAAEAARVHAPPEPCCAGCAEGQECEGEANLAPLPYSGTADLYPPCGGLPFEDEAAAVYSNCAAASPRQRPLVLPTPEEAAAEVAAEGAGGARRDSIGPGAALKGLGSPSSLAAAATPPRPRPPVTTCHPCSPNYSPRSGYFSPQPTPRCDPNSMPIPRPVSPCCSPNFVGAHVRDFPYSSRLLPSHSSPLSSPRRMEAPASPLPTFAEWRYPSPGRKRSASPSGFAARPYLGEATPFPYPLPPYSKFPMRPLSPARHPLASAYGVRPYMDPYPTASNLLPIDPYGGLGYTDGRHLRALSPTRFSDYENIPVTSPRRGYLEHLAHIEAETQRLRRELRGY